MSSTDNIEASGTGLFLCLLPIKPCMDAIKATERGLSLVLVHIMSLINTLKAHKSIICYTRHLGMAYAHA